ncbi:hypothetical protein [Streptomyces sp. NPDC053048]|uniref:hypothetical protein n=1 Tax=Streptomyces sp. NPDC053048 TaxID=3365694 RepID=UPI0037D58396
MSRRTHRVTGKWPWARDSRYESTDHARVRAKARKWAAAGATAVVEEGAGAWTWRHVRTYEPPPAVEQQLIVEEPAPAVEDDDQDETSLYERLMRQAPTGRDHRGRVPCRHVVGGRGIR